MTVVGVISDTHGLLRPEAVAALAGVRLILHAGDVGRKEVVHELERIAPVHAVGGNVDQGDWLPESLTIRVEDARVYMRHIAGELDVDPADYSVVIFGHSHRASIERRGGTLFLNPGSAGPRRFRLPVTVALLTIDGSRADAEIVHLAI